MKRQPPGHTRTCAVCDRHRGNTRKGWHFVTRDGQAVGVTCPECPRWDEPIRRLVVPDGSVKFRAVVDATPAGAPRRRQATRTLPSLDAARAFVAEVRAEVAASGGFADAGSETVAALCARWLRSRRGVREVTAEGYRHQLAASLRWLGPRPITSVTPADVSTLVEWLGTEGGQWGHGLGPRGIRAALGRLAQAFDIAVREGTLRRNVFRDAERPRMRKPVGTDVEHWPTTGRLDTARCEYRDRFREVSDTDPLAGAWRLSLAGMTRADVLGLRWSDVDLDAGTVTVRQGRVEVTGGTTTDDPKSAQRRRTVPVEQVLPGTVRLLRAMRAAQAADRLAAGESWQDSGLVVVDALGRGLSPAIYSRRFPALCREAGVPVIRLHSLRHTLAFYLHALGVAPADAAAILGHTLAVHLATYMPHAGASGIAAAAAALGAAQQRAGVGA